MARYTVNYEGWVIVEAEDESHAEAQANALLSEADLINDGVDGEWLLGEVTEEEDED